MQIFQKLKHLGTFVCLFLVMLGLNSRPQAFYAGALLLELHPSPYWFGYFRNRLSLYAQASLDLDLLIFASPVAGMTGTHHHMQLLLVKMGVSLTFWLG
jgi:hypothetical protein